MKAKLFLAGLFLSSLLIQGFQSNPEINTSLPSSIRVYPGVNHQFQTWIAAHPLNSQILAGTAITDIYPGGYTTGAYVSTNGGLNWTGTNAIKDINGAIHTTVGDPSITIDKNGVMIIAFTATPWAGGSGAKVGVHYSTNNGAYWSNKIYVPGVDTSDKVICTTDNHAASPYFGHSYVIYSERRKGGIYFSKTTNGGANWDTAKRICPPFKEARTGAAISTGANGEIYVCWPFFDGPAAKNYLGFAKSTDGGSTWTMNDTAIFINLQFVAHRLNMLGVRLHGLPTMSVDRSGGPRHGTIYIAAMEKSGTGSPALDDFDIILHSSTDNGATWNPSKRINQDNTGSLKYQFYPTLSVDPHGGVNVLYYDTRATPTNDSFEVYVSRSVNGGNTFEDFPVTEQKFKLAPISPSPFGVPGYIGTYAGLTSTANTINPFWYDNRTGFYQANTAQIQYTSEVTAIPQGMFNPVTGKLNRKTHIKVYLRSSVSPYNKVDSITGILDSITFKAKIIFRNAPSGNYFLEISDKNSLQTWSGTPVEYSVLSGLNYDFTLAPNQAFGGILININGKWCIYSADVNVDGLINLNDITYIFNHSVVFTSGNVPSDVNGDDIVNLNDILVCFNNSVNFVQMITP